MAKKTEFVCKIVNSQFATTTEEAAQRFIKTLEAYRGREIPVEVKRPDGSDEHTIQTHFHKVETATGRMIDQARIRSLEHSLRNAMEILKDALENISSGEWAINQQFYGTEIENIRGFLQNTKI